MAAKSKTAKCKLSKLDAAAEFYMQIDFSGRNMDPKQLAVLNDFTREQILKNGWFSRRKNKKGDPDEMLQSGMFYAVLPLLRACGVDRPSF